MKPLFPTLTLSCCLVLVPSLRVHDFSEAANPQNDITQHQTRPDARHALQVDNASDRVVARPAFAHGVASKQKHTDGYVLQEPSISRSSEDARARRIDELAKQEGTPTAVLVDFVRRAGDWKAALGLVFFLPACVLMIRYTMNGRSLDPYLLSRDALSEFNLPHWASDVFPMTAILGLDLMILTGLEHDWQGTVFVITFYCGFIVGVVGFALFLFSVMHHHSPYHHDDENNHEPEEITNHFQNFANSTLRVVVLCFGLSMLMKFYVYDMMAEVELSPRAYMYFLAAMPMQIISKELLGDKFSKEIRLWRKLLDTQDDIVIDPSGANKTHHVTKGDLIFRASMAFFCNNVCIATLYLTLPVFMMSAAGDIDFVKDCFAVVFITTLDDMANPIPLQLSKPSVSKPSVSD